MKGITQRFAALLSLVFVASLSYGQVVDKKSLSLEGARRVIAAAKEYSTQQKAPGGVIAVVDDGGNLVALERLDGTFSAGANISIGKAKTAVMFKRPTKFFEDVIKQGRTAMVALPDFTPLQGGVPVKYEGKIIGGVGVSGAASAQQDEEIAIAGAAALKGASVTENSSAVTYIESQKVEAAFAKGAVLENGSKGQNYMVHASRREGPGMAEIHERDTDIIYVLNGTATFVTGGSAVGAASTESGEIRGTAIAGGETRKISKGDVLIIPKGVPHWFKEINNPFTYYVVKVR